MQEGEQLNPANSERVKQATTVSVLRRFRQYSVAVLRFVGDVSAPFTNNTAARVVRL